MHSVTQVCDMEYMTEETEKERVNLCSAFLPFVISTFSTVSKDNVDEAECLLVMYALSVPYGVSSHS